MQPPMVIGVEFKFAIHVDEKTAENVASSIVYKT